MSDKQRFLARVKNAGTQGVHSHDIRREGISGHPSERARELEGEGIQIRREREFVNGRNGVRFFYEGIVELGGDDNFQEPTNEKGSANVAHTPQLSDPEPTQLFDEEIERKPRIPSAYDPWAA